MRCEPTVICTANVSGSCGTTSIGVFAGDIATRIASMRMQPNVPSISATADPVYLGVCFASILYGITCCQTFNYYRSQRARLDHPLIKSLVAVVWALDTFQLAAAIHYGRFCLIVEQSDVIKIFLHDFPWSYPAGVFSTAFIGALVQCFLVYRIQKLSNNIWMSAITGILVLGSLGSELIYPIRMFFLSGTPAFLTLTVFKSLPIISLSFTLAVDTVVCFVLLYCLYKRRTGFRRSNNLISRLMALTVSTGGLTIFDALACLVVYLVAPSSTWEFVFSSTLSKLYANALLTVLNTRSAIHRGLRNPQDATADANSIPLTRLGLKREGGGEDQSHTINIVVSETVETDMSSAKQSLGVGDTDTNFKFA
ncbi:hypothetical protein NM688_g8774 [Phlebia brevispora]|uniref:Uncharacterized protein n=1 Tax=Phlebia brevispora TaxID=194682 RepID=A0ACC1RNR3_9APHY|nr:hypothetical protein NM688_g8774 [Phlebia brevispora]